jgi:hypothetical protein
MHALDGFRLPQMLIRSLCYEPYAFMMDEERVHMLAMLLLGTPGSTPS